jgi:hypothetical protein
MQKIKNKKDDPSSKRLYHRPSPAHETLSSLASREHSENAGCLLSDIEKVVQEQCKVPKVVSVFAAEYVHICSYVMCDV